ncbi:MAG: hypothetical protein AAF335_04920 [Bacteroidota bacterium]
MYLISTDRGTVTPLKSILVPVPVAVPVVTYPTHPPLVTHSGHGTHVSMANFNVLPPSNSTVSLWDWNTPSQPQYTQIPQFNIPKPSASTTPIISPSTSVTLRSVTPTTNLSHGNFSFFPTTSPSNNTLSSTVNTGISNAPLLSPSFQREPPPRIQEQTTTTAVSSLPMMIFSKPSQKKKKRKEKKLNSFNARIVIKYFLEKPI